jgi:hypothetical protein
MHITRTSLAHHSHNAGQGAVVGVTDFVLRRLRSFQGTAVSECTVVEVTRAALEVMVAEVPQVATALQVRLVCVCVCVCGWVGGGGIAPRWWPGGSESVCV